jgi:F-type H+-transporting ATPase subunit gamma
MKLVSAAKLRRATEAATSARPYQQALVSTLQRVAAGAGEIEDPLLTQREHVRTVLLVAVGSDRGLCGGFNSTLGRRAVEWIRAQREAGHEVIIWTFGKKPRDFFRGRGFAVAETFTGVTPPKFVETVKELGARLVEGYRDEKFDEVVLASNVFKSTIAQIPTFAKVVPVAIETGDAAAVADYVQEPSGSEILGVLLPLYLRTALLQAFLENEAGEHAARMQAMDAATRNANEMIKALTLEYNRGRQAAITKELIEIVSGAEAL